MTGPIVRRLALAWMATAAVLIAALYPHVTAGRKALRLTDWFLFHQDLPVLWAVAAVALVGLGVSFALPAAPGAGSPARPIAPRTALVVAAIVALACGLVAWAGTFVVFDNYALSMDEFMANFDAAILSHGQLMAPVAVPWRALLGALQPTFVTVAPGDLAWSSQYLPVNAGLRALGELAGAPSLVSPLLAVVCVMAIFGVARRLWPARPDLAVAAAALLATSSQFLVTAMTPYAMTAHLAFNLVWLWLFLRGGGLSDRQDNPILAGSAASHAGAILVGFLATGLHQFVFHPLFAAPFIAELLFARRWRLALTYIAAYGLICGFWIGYWRFAFALVGHAGGAVGPAAMGKAAATDLTSRITALWTTVDPAAPRIMVANLIRFVSWQSLLTLPLAVLGVVAAIRTGGAVRALLLGLVLTAIAMFVLIPHQGHGWGYRYLHGLLGSTCLLAAFAWGRLTDRLSAGARRWAGVSFAVFASLSFLVLLPLRASQAHAFVHPYARAWAAIAHAPSAVVVVDPAGAWYASDLVRNDPYLRRGPLVFDIRVLTEAQLGELCAHRTLSVFKASDAVRLGIKTSTRTRDDEEEPPPRDRLRDSGCAASALAQP
jgi:hypothetical protein